MKVLIDVYSPINHVTRVPYTVIKKYENGSVLAIPDEYKQLMDSCKGKPTLFNKQQVKGFID